MRQLQFRANDTLNIASRTDGSHSDIAWKDGGSNTLLIQNPGSKGMSGQWLEDPGPAARCPIRLTPLTMTIVDCQYDRLIGTYHR